MLCKTFRLLGGFFVFLGKREDFSWIVNLPLVLSGRAKWAAPWACCCKSWDTCRLRYTAALFPTANGWLTNCRLRRHPIRPQLQLRQNLFLLPPQTGKLLPWLLQLPVREAAGRGKLCSMPAGLWPVMFWHRSGPKGPGRYLCTRCNPLPVQPVPGQTCRDHVLPWREMSRP